MSRRSVNLLRKIKGDFAIKNANVATESSEGLRDARSFRSVTSGVAKTTMTAAELSVNTHYVASTATALAMTIPSAAAGN